MKKEHQETKKQPLANSGISKEGTMYIIKHTLFEECNFDGESEIAVALSGGPDSVCLLFLLKQISDGLKADSATAQGFKITAIHLNHCLRGRESDRDEQFCKDICKRLGVELVVESVDVAREATKAGKGLEEYGRQARYQLFERVCIEKGIKYVAVGHNKEDNAETVFMNIVRGTGLEGLKGITYERLLCDAKTDGESIHVVRPMLDVSRKQIEQVCFENQLMPIIDSSNLETDYRRNKVRLSIFPMIEEQLQVNIVDKLCEMSKLVAIDERYMEKLSQMAYNKVLVKDSNAICLDAEKLVGLDTALAGRVVREAYDNTAHTMVDFGMGHVGAVLDLCRSGDTGKQIDLPHNVRAVLQYGNLIFEKKDEKKDNEKEKIVPINISAEDILSNPNGYTIDVKKGKMSFRVESATSCDLRDSLRPRRAKPYDMCFDFEQLFADDSMVSVRARRAGDIISPVSGGGKKKLKDYFIDLKIPREERDDIVLLTKGNDVVWAVGITPDKRYLVTDKTKRICYVHIQLT